MAALRRRLRLVRSMGGRTPLRPEVLAELTAVGAHTEPARRARSLFGVPAPPPGLPMRLSRATDTALRVLTTLGPLPVEVLCAAVNRARQPTANLPPISCDDLAVGLRFRGASQDADDGVWSAPSDAQPVERDRRLVEALRARSPVTRVQLHHVLLEVGYTAKTPQTPIVDRSPLIRRTAPNRYELVADQVTPAV